MADTYPLWLHAGRHGQPVMGQPGSAWTFGDDANVVYRAVSWRLRMFTMNQVDHTWRRRDGDALEPYGLAFLFLEPDRMAGPDERIKAGTRMFRESEYITDAVSVLRDLAGVVRGHGAGGLDVVGQMCTGHDPISPQARYVGVAFSTMDLPGEPWAMVRRRLEVAAHVDTRVLVLLLDGTMLQIERKDMAHRRDFQVSCSVPGDRISIGSTSRRWVPSLTDLADPNTRDLWLALRDLHQLTVWSQYGG